MVYCPHFGEADRDFFRIRTPLGMGGHRGPSPLRREKPGNPEQVVGGGDDHARGAGLGPPSEPCSSEAPDRLHPAEDLLDEKSLLAADAIAGVGGGPENPTGRWGSAKNNRT